MLGKNTTFDEIKREVRQMNLGEFIKFCTDFDLKVNKMVIIKYTILISIEINGNIQEDSCL